MLEEKYYPEIVIGFAYGAGTDQKKIEHAVIDCLQLFNYEVKTIILSHYLDKYEEALAQNPEFERISKRMDTANKLCNISGLKNFLAYHAIADISKMRVPNNEPLQRTAHLLFSLKRPEEVELLREIYDQGFILIGVFSNLEDRMEYLTKEKYLIRS